jgi:hypothetical protein
MKLFNSKIKREEIVQAILDLESQVNSLENRIDQFEFQRIELIGKGKETTDRTKRLMLAKKISFMDEEKQETIKQVMMLMYNLNLSRKLKQAIESNDFTGKMDSSKINQMLGNQKKLASFLNKALKRRIKVEDMLTETDDLFKQVNNQYETNEKIYGINTSDDELLSIFEQNDLQQLDDFKDINKKSLVDDTKKNKR